jgi:hypothetical protein
VNDSLVPVFVSGVNSNPSLRRPSITRSVCNLRPDFAATARKNFEKWREPKRLCRFFLADLKVADIVTAPMRNPTSLRTIFASATLFLVLASCTAHGHQSAPQIPSQLSFLPSLGEVRKNIEYERWGEKKFPPSDTAKRGQHWTLLVNLRPFTDRQANWAAMKPTFLKNGWTVVKEFGTGSSVITLSSTQNGAEAWVAVDMDPTVKIICGQFSSTRKAVQAAENIRQIRLMPRRRR